MTVYDVITTRIIDHLERGTIPWRRPWRGGDAGAPRNLQSGRPYRGVNVFLLVRVSAHRDRSFQSIVTGCFNPS